MNQQELQALLEFLSSSDIQELKLEGDDFRLEVRRNLPGPAPVLMAAAPQQLAAAQPQAAPLAPPPPAAYITEVPLIELDAPIPPMPPYAQL